MAPKKMTKVRRAELLESFFQQFKDGMVKSEGLSFEAIIRQSHKGEREPSAQAILKTIAEIEGIVL